MPSLSWYARRLSRMSPSEVADRARHQAVKVAWRRRQVRPGATDPLVVPAVVPAFAAVLPAGGGLEPDPAAVAELLDTAELLLKGHATILGVDRLDFDAPGLVRRPGHGRARTPGRLLLLDRPSLTGRRSASSRTSGSRPGTTSSPCWPRPTG